MSKNILVVDDEKAIADLVEVYLTKEGYQVYKCYTGREAMQYIADEQVDLAILDLMLPDMSGFEICQKIRENHTYPIIMLTARDEQFDKISGLMLGADDYVTKPFLPLELVARVKAQLRRYFQFSKSNNQKETLITISGLVLNIETRECTLNEKPLQLTPTEFDILRILCQNKGVPVSSETLFQSIWKDEYYTKSNNTITVHVRHLREKMKDNAENPKYIKTVWGVGYKIED